MSLFSINNLIHVVVVCTNITKQKSRESNIRIYTEVTSTPTRPVENVVITTKGLQDRNNLLLDRRTVENKGKLILTNIHTPQNYYLKIHFIL